MRRIALVALALLAGCVSRPAPDGTVALAARPVALDPSDPARVAVGRLRYLGGLELRSGDKRFGGLSGLRVRGDGWALAVSDEGRWVAFPLVERDGRLVGVGRARVAPLLDERGQPPAGKPDGDAEAIEWAADGTAIVTFEQDHRMQVYRGVDPARPDGLSMRAARVVRSPETRDWPANSGAEAYAAVGEDADVAIAEDPTLPGGAHDAFGQFDGNRLRFAYRPPAPGFKPTDAADLGDGRLLVLHRRFAPADGASALVAILDPTLIGDADGKPLAAQEVARLAPPLSVDNMEALAIRRDSARTFVYLLSDNNFSKVQKTLLLKFELVR